MKAIMVMYDSLNRHMLPPYGCDWTVAPNFSRLAERTVTFDRCYVGSMPCMPARREIHTGRYNFMHRSWGPMEPFDVSMPELLSRAGVWTHLISDHYHYWEDGGATYHNRYSSWEAVRGQEGDPWKVDLSVRRQPEDFNPAPYSKIGGGGPEASFPRGRGVQDWVNRSFMPDEADMPQAVTFDKGMDFLERNHGQDDWFLTLETFDPHEPFFTQPGWREKYGYDYDALGMTLDWPPYREVAPGEEEIVNHYRYRYAALLTMCDHYLGLVLDAMDRYDLWQDTMLIVCTDHGFLLGEHGWYAKNQPPLYNEIANTPLFIWDPRCGRKGERNDCLVQTIDLAPTLLEYFGQPVPQSMQGRPLREALSSHEPVREAALFGYHGLHMNMVDDRCVYMLAPDVSVPVCQYTLMPTHMRGFFSAEMTAQAEMYGGFSFTEGHRVMKMAGRPGRNRPFDTMLFDLQEDPGQERPQRDEAVEARLKERLTELMRESEAPPELYSRFGCPAKA